MDAPRSRVGLDDTVLDQHLDELLDVERVAVGPFDDQVDRAHGTHVGRLEHLVDERPASSPGRAARARSRIGSDAAESQFGRRSSNVERAAPRRGGRVFARLGRRIAVEDVQRLVVGPVEVLEEQHDRSVGRQRLEVADQVGPRRPRQLAASRAGAARPRSTAGRSRASGRRRRPRPGRARARGRRASCRRRGGRVAVEHAEAVAEQVAQRGRTPPDCGAAQRATLEEVRGSPGAARSSSRTRTAAATCRRRRRR